MFWKGNKGEADLGESGGGEEGLEGVEGREAKLQYGRDVWEKKKSFSSFFFLREENHLYRWGNEQKLSMSGESYDT